MTQTDQGHNPNGICILIGGSKGFVRDICPPPGIQILSISWEFGKIVCSRPPPHGSATDPGPLQPANMHYFHKYVLQSFFMRFLTLTLISQLSHWKLKLRKVLSWLNTANALFTLSLMQDMIWLWIMCLWSLHDVCVDSTTRCVQDVDNTESNQSLTGPSFQISSNRNLKKQDWAKMLHEYQVLAKPLKEFEGRLQNFEKVFMSIDRNK